MRQAVRNGSVQLNSWKEIASYLDRGVRTVQRWERELELPVHRIGKGKRSPVYATTTELNFWMATAESGRAKHAGFQNITVRGTDSKPIEDSRRLLMTYRRLARSVAENSVRQHHQAEILTERLIRMRARIR